METLKITAIPRDTGKGPANRLRSQGYIPAVLYGKQVGNLALALNAKELNKVVEQRGASAVSTVEMDGQKYTAVIRELQRHPVRGDILHCDLFQVSEKDRIETVVPIQLIGEAKGVNAGGILQYQLREVEIECQISQIPEAIEGDISALEIGDSLKVADLIVPEGVEVITDPETVVASITAPQVIADEGEEAAEEAGESAPQEGE